MRQALGFHIQGFSSLFGQHVSVFILDQPVEVKAGDSLADSRLTYTERHVSLDSLPKVPFKRRESNVFLLFSLVLLNDVQNHEVVLVHLVVNRSR